MNHEQEHKPCQPLAGMISRRAFLGLGGATLVTLSLPNYLRRLGIPAELQAQQVDYPRQVVGRLSELQPGVPVSFNYPWDHPLAVNFLIQLGEPAGGGVGPDQNVVAFNSFCTHQGGPLTGQVHGEIGVAGPCPLHWTTFDLTRHGMVISGHATEGLPQIILETEGDEILATGVLGLVFGFYDNLADPNA